MIADRRTGAEHDAGGVGSPYKIIRPRLRYFSNASARLKATHAENCKRMLAPTRRVLYIHPQVGGTSHPALAYTTRIAK